MRELEVGALRLILESVLTANDAAPEAVRFWTGATSRIPLAEAVNLVNEYCGGAPVAYLVGHMDFLGHRFRSDGRACAVRNYSEPLIEAAIEDWRGRPVRALDVGCGAGAFIVTLAKELRGEFIGVDVDDRALELAAENVRLHGVEVELLKSDIFSGIEGRFDVIVGNLPTERPRPDIPEAEREPLVALVDQSEQRYGLLSRFLDELPERLTERGRAYLECGGSDELLRALPGTPVHTRDAEPLGTIITREESLDGAAGMRAAGLVA